MAEATSEVRASEERPRPPELSRSTDLAGEGRDPNGTERDTRSGSRTEVYRSADEAASAEFAKAREMIGSAAKHADSPVDNLSAIATERKEADVGRIASFDSQMGSRGHPYRDGPPNVATDINGRTFGGHALDRMQQQGITPSVVEDAVSSSVVEGKRPGTSAHYSEANDLTVITDTESGRVITVDYGRIRAMTEEFIPDQGIRARARGALDDFRAGSTSLRDLITRLEDVWDSLPESDWKIEFRGYWWTLEQVYAVAIDRQELDALPADAVVDVEEAVSGLEALVAG